MEKLEDIFSKTNLVDFANMIHNDEDCKRFLVECKWKNGYVCYKCHHNAYQERKDLSRTCNKCGYTESPTAHTVFHKVKFGLTKAFFISFEYFKYKDLDVSSLSKIYNVRKSAVQLFFQKLEQVHCLKPSCHCH